MRVVSVIFCLMQGSHCQWRGKQARVVFGGGDDHVKPLNELDDGHAARLDWGERRYLTRAGQLPYVIDGGKTRSETRAPTAPQSLLGRTRPGTRTIELGRAVMALAEDCTDTQGLITIISGLESAQEGMKKPEELVERCAA